MNEITTNGRDEVVEMLEDYIHAMQRDISALNSFKKDEYEKEDLSSYIMTLQNDLHELIGNLEDVEFFDKEK